jgi:hypothetical protein
LEIEEHVHSEDIRTALKQLICENPNSNTWFDLCIFDGICNESRVCDKLRETLNWAVMYGRLRKVMYVSRAFDGKETGSAEGKFFKPVSVQELSLDSWLLQDYQDAMTCEQFVEQMHSKASAIFKEDKDYLLKQSEPFREYMDDNAADGQEASILDIVNVKYHYTGGNACYMFQFALSEIKEHFQKLFYRIGFLARNWEIFAQQTSIAATTPYFVAALMQQFRGACVPVSKYVLYHAYSMCKGRLVDSLKEKARMADHPIFKEFFFELRQVHLIRTILDTARSSEATKGVTNRMGSSFNTYRSCAKYSFAVELRSKDACTLAYGKATIGRALDLMNQRILGRANLLK